MTDHAILRCSFCNKTQDEVRKLIKAPAACICDECIELCNDILIDEGGDHGVSMRDLLRMAWRTTWRRIERWSVPPDGPRPGSSH